MKRKPVELQLLGGVYRVPLKKVYKSKRIDKELLWDDVYGKHKCVKCKKHFREGDPYTVIVLLKKNRAGDETFEPIHKYQHVECEK